MDGPISIDDARNHMRVTTRDEDENIGRLIRVAARQIETIYGIVAVQREQSFSFDNFQREMRVPLIPVKPDAISIVYVDASGTEQPFTNFRSFERYDWTWLTPSVDMRWPTAAAIAGAVTVKATVGYITPGQPVGQQGAVPDDIQQATRLMVEHLFLRSSGALPPGVDDLINHYRFRRV